MSAKYIFVTGGVVSSIGKGCHSKSWSLAFKSWIKEVTIKNLTIYQY